MADTTNPPSTTNIMNIPTPSTIEGARTEGISFPIKSLDDNGRNYRTWQMRMVLLLQCAKVWDVVDPAGPPMPTEAGPQQDVWLDKDITALLHINCHIGDNAMLAINEATHT